MSFKTTKEILVHIFNGGKVIDPDRGVIIFLKEDGNLNDSYSFAHPHDWQPYEEPKKKVKLYKWAYEKRGDGYRDTHGYYRDEGDVIKNIQGPLYNLMRLDYTMIEVDEES